MISAVYSLFSGGLSGGSERKEGQRKMKRKMKRENVKGRGNEEDKKGCVCVCV
jgi:hypothetical protein